MTRRPDRLVETRTEEDAVSGASAASFIYQLKGGK